MLALASMNMHRPKSKLCPSDNPCVGIVLTSSLSSNSTHPALLVFQLNIWLEDIMFRSEENSMSNTYLFLV